LLTSILLSVKPWSIKAVYLVLVGAMWIWADSSKPPLGKVNGFSMYAIPKTSARFKPFYLL
ncbi:MAG: hypothetical protein QXZ50_06755, partial [Ignisphaera sp.]